MACASRYVCPYWGHYEHRGACLQSAVERYYQSTAHRERRQLLRAHATPHDCHTRARVSANPSPEPVPEVHATRAVPLRGRVLGARRTQRKSAAALAHGVARGKPVECLYAGGTEEGWDGGASGGVPAAAEQRRSVAGGQRTSAAASGTDEHDRHAYSDTARTGPR